MADNICEFCDKKFTTAFNLKNHKNTAVYCLKLRGGNVTKQYKCEFCNENFTQKITLTKHSAICTGFKLQKTLEKEIDSLKEKLKEEKQQKSKISRTLKLSQTKILKSKQKIINLEQILQKNQETISNLRSDCETKLEETEINHSLEIEKLQRDYDATIEELEINRSLEIEKLHHKNELTIKKLESDRALEFEKLKSDHVLEVEKLKQEKDEKDKKIIELEKNIEYGKGVLIGYKQVKPPNVVTNNTIVNQKLASIKIDNIRPLTVATIIEDIPKYTFDMYMKAEDGIVEFMKGLTQLELEDGSIERNYACTDKSRNTFHKLIESREWTQDGGAQIINKVFDILSNKSEEHWSDLTELTKHHDQGERESYSRRRTILVPFHLSFTNKGHREEYFNKVKNKLSYTSSV